MNKNKTIELVNFHVGRLEKKLEDIYTVEPPQDYKDKQNVEKVNVLVELNDCEEAAAFYSVVEEEGVHEGEVYQEYSGYLKNIRESIQTLKALQKEIEQAHAADIANTRLLLNIMNKKVEKSSQS
jgi:hypothetical protein